MTVKMGYGVFSGDCEFSRTWVSDRYTVSWRIAVYDRDVEASYDGSTVAKAL